MAHWKGEATECKPCPWCKRLPVAKVQDYEKGKNWSIGCPSAFTTTPEERAVCKMAPCAVMLPSLPEAKKLWNSH